MKAKDVKVGGTYLAKISGKRTSIRIESKSAYGGWNATNLTTNRKVRIKSAASLHRSTAEEDAAELATNVEPAPAWLPTPEEIAEGEALTATAAATEPEQPTVEMDDTPVAAPDETLVAAPAPMTRKKLQRADGTMSGLDAAAKVLADAGEPLDCKTIVESAIALGIWKPAGLTPVATLSSALQRDIAAKGEHSRFRKTDRGRFATA